ncbi:MAG: metallopeptidase TldD-related protein, partial [Candidatus Bathyarchaeia archaeon]
QLGRFDPISKIRVAIENIVRCKGGKMVEPGRYDVIFSPYAMAELAEHVLAYGLDLSAVDSGISYYRGMLGKKVADECFSLFDDGHHSEGIASKTFDDEGVPTNTTILVNQGILQNLLCDSYYAAKMSSPLREFSSTGNGFRFGPVPGRDYSSLPRIQPTNLVIKEGRQRLEELIDDTKKGLLIGRIWYSYPINPTIGEFSATNRGDTFYIEDGQVKNPVPPNSLRVNDNLPKLLKQIGGITRDQVQSVVWGGVSSCIAPYIRFKDVNITYTKGY